MTRTCLLAFTHTTQTHALRVSVYLLLLLWSFSGISEAFAGAHSTARGKAGEIRPATIYHNYCSVCHGDKGDGRSRAQNSLNPPPKDFTTPAASQLTRTSMIEAVTNGRPGTAMIAWKTQLNQKEIEALVDYVRNTFMSASHSVDSSRGRNVYSKNCSVCHGENGDGRSRAQGSLNPPPRDFTTVAARTELSEQRMLTSIAYGRPDTAMAGFKNQLSKEDISAVVDYIRTRFMTPANTADISGIQNARPQTAPQGLKTPLPTTGSTPAPAHVHKHVTVNMSTPMPHGLKGDVKKGEAFFMDNCATCHGKTGDGRGPRAYFINPKPRNFLHPAAREMLNRVELFEMISVGKPGTEMPAWDKVLSQQEIANVAEFVFQRFIQPGAASKKSANAAKQ